MSDWTLKTLLAVAVIAVLLVAHFARQRALVSPRQGDSPKPSMPADWPDWQALLDQQRLKALSISLSDEKPTLPWQSKFGGEPYWPRDKPIPVDSRGAPMHLLAQINFSEIEPKLEGYPEDGLLQFFVADNDMYGVQFVPKDQDIASYLDVPKDHAVVFHETVIHDRDLLERRVSATGSAEMLPLTGEAAIEFELIEDVATPDDYRFERITRALGELRNDVWDYAYATLYGASVHKIGGYANFTQWDPREHYDANGGWLLLFQMNSDANDHIDIMWGDVGIGNFFIRPDDLAKRDFSRVWYSWDCH